MTTRSLEDGGEAILSSRGDLGQLLFSASAGLAEIGGRLEALRESADAFHRSRASTSELAKMKHELGELQDERKKADTLASTYAELIRQRDKAKEDFEAAAKSLSKRRVREDEIQRLLAALPHLAALREAEGRLAPLSGLPTPPEGWGKTLASLQDEAIRLGGQKEIAESAIRTLQGEAEAIADDAAALAVADRVGAWRELRSRFDAAKDIPVRQGELAAKRGDVQGVLRRLGRENEAEASAPVAPGRHRRGARGFDRGAFGSGVRVEDGGRGAERRKKRARPRTRRGLAIRHRSGRPCRSRP